MSSQRRKERRHYLKQIKKVVSAKEFKDIKREFQAEGRRLRIEDLREYLEKEQEELANQESKLREQYKSEGLKKKEIDAKIEKWYDGVKIWALHSDVYDELV